MGRGWLGALAVIAIVAGLCYTGLHWVKAAGEETCQVCRRPVHQHSRTVALVGGRKVFYCCPTCALSQHQQGGKPVVVTELTDYATGARLAPADAWAVRGSDLNPCIRKEALVDADRRVAPVEFDRCSPGLLTFARRADAAEFMAAHGGQLARFSDLSPAFAR